MGSWRTGKRVFLSQTELLRIRGNQIILFAQVRKICYRALWGEEKVYENTVQKARGRIFQIPPSTSPKSKPPEKYLRSLSSSRLAGS